MSAPFEQELAELKQKLLRMAAQAEGQVVRAFQAMVDRNDDLARQVKEDDSILDEFEKEIDDLAISLLAKAQLASQLRLITVAMKASHNLERVGDEATTIARRAVDLNAEAPLSLGVNLTQMADQGLDLLRQALDAFVNQDASKARVIIPRDRQIDARHKQLQRELTLQMAERPSVIRRSLNLMTISKSLERIADHATNIAEEVVYLQEAVDIRHDPAIKRVK